MNENYQIARQIWKEILQCSEKVLTWGFVFASVQSVVNGTKFYVAGNLTGWISIQQEPGTNLYDINITPSDELPIIYRQVEKQNVVEVIDEQIHYKEEPILV